MVKKHLGRNSILSCLTIIIVSVLAFNSTFIFNPITYSEDYITSQDWYQYRTPLEVGYYRWCETGGWIEVGLVGNMKEAKYIINELKNAKETEYTQDDYLIPYESRGEEYIVLISRKYGEQEYVNLVHFNFFENGELVDLGNDHYLKLSDEVRDLLLDRLV